MDTETEIPDVRSSPGPSSSEVDVPNLMREEITDISLSSSGPSSSETVDVPNLLSRLKCPASSDLSRKRKLIHLKAYGLVRVPLLLSPLFLLPPELKNFLMSTYLWYQESYFVRLVESLCLLRRVFCSSILNQLNMVVAKSF